MEIAQRYHTQHPWRHGVSRANRLQNVPRLVSNWTAPIIVGRHAFGDQYRATDVVIPGKGKLLMKFVGEDGKEMDYEVYNFKGPGVALSMYNTEESIRGFVHSCFNMALNKNGLSICQLKTPFSKNTMAVLKIFFRKYMWPITKPNLKQQELYMNTAWLTIWWLRRLNGTGILCGPVKLWRRRSVWFRCTGIWFAGFNDLSACNTRWKIMEAEAAHGTVTRHYRDHRAGKANVNQPHCKYFCWTRGLEFRGKLDGNQELINFCQTLEKVCVATVESGKMTKDLAVCAFGNNVKTWRTLSLHRRISGCAGFRT